MPSIQLAILRQCLDGVADASTFEFYVDYAATISERLYRPLSEAGGVVEEWLFAQSYFEPEGIPMPAGFLEELPPLDLGSRKFERRVVQTLAAVTGDYLARLSEDIKWGSYDVVAFSLTIYQTASSMALARLIRRKHPKVQIVFGGNSCVGPAAKAIMQVCPYVDVVVRTEAEPVFANLVRHLVNGLPLDTLPGITFRRVDGSIVETLEAGLHRLDGEQAPLQYDSYFDRVERCDLGRRDHIWLPFESSRGCWWGEKSQCTFCGLHDIMNYRVRRADDVLQQLDWLFERYRVPRFFATDLIMPSTYYKTLLPKLIESDRQYELFYELKPNVTRRMMAQLAAAGVTKLQPGLESLSTHVLKLMKKGLSATQTAQFLKWSTEYGMHVGWNVIVGMPGETAEDLETVAARIPSLCHLSAPYFIHFELQRFSPIFENAARYGLSNIRPLYLYRYIYPVEPRLLKALAYKFEYDAADFDGTPPWLDGDSKGEHGASVRRAVEAWKDAAKRGATLNFRRLDDSSLEILDKRDPSETRTYRLPPEAALLYEYLDSQRCLARLAEDFEGHAPAATLRLGRRAGIEAQVMLWLEDRLVFEADGYVVALAVASEPNVAILGQEPEESQARISDTLVGSSASRSRDDRSAGEQSRDTAWEIRVIEEYMRERRFVEADETLEVQPRVSTRKAFLVSASRGGKWFVKRFDGPDADERIYTAREHGELPSLVADLIPSRSYDSAADVAVYAAIVGHLPWHDWLEGPDGFSPLIAAAVGRALAGLHAASAFPNGPPARLCLGPPFRTYERITVKELADGPGLHYRDFAAVAQRVSWRLRELREAWQPECFIHGDVKADNVLIGETDPESVRFVDWELARMGDPLYDVGTAIGSVVMMWLNFVEPIADADLEDWFGQMTVSSTVLCRCLDAFISTYLSASGSRDSANYRHRAWLYAGVFLLERGFAATWIAGRLNLNSKLAMELGAGILETPERAVAAFLAPELARQ